MSKKVSEGQGDVFSTKDLIEMPLINGLCIDATNEGSIFYCVKSFSFARGTTVSELYHYSLPYGSSTKLTSLQNDSLPTALVWNCEFNGLRDCVYFLRQGQIYGIPLDGGEARRVSDFSLSVQTFKIYMGAFKQIYIVVSFDVYPDLPSIDDTLARDADTAKKKASGKVFTSLMVRQWDKWDIYKKRNHIFICRTDITSEGLLVVDPQSPPIDLMEGLESDCPVKGSRYQHFDYTISPHGDRIALTMRPTDSEGKQLKDCAWTTNMDIVIGDLTLIPFAKEQFQLKSIFEVDKKKKVFCSHPVFSQNGKWMCYLTMQKPGFESDRKRIMVYDLESKEHYNLTEDIDVSFNTLVWGNDDKSLFATAFHQASSRIFRLFLNSDATQVTSVYVLRGDESRAEIHFSEGYRSYISFVESAILSPPKVIMQVTFATEDKIGEEFEPFIPLHQSAGISLPACSDDYERFMGDRRLVHSCNSSLSNGDVQVPLVRALRFQGGGGDLVHSWYLAPIGDESSFATHSKGLIVLLHGGPQGCFFNTWMQRWNSLWYASLGYGVLSLNFHGSASFGADFVESIHHDWGDKPYEDVLSAADFALENFTYLDPNRLAAGGASYGGYLSNWINGHSSRFKCLISHAGIFTLSNMYNHTEELWFPEWEFGSPHVNREEYEKWSPDIFAAQMKTPTLVVHGGKDYRVPETEGIATFNTLQRLGVPSKFLYFPDEGHWTVAPANSVLWHDTVEDWLWKYIGEDDNHKN